MTAPVSSWRHLRRLLNTKTITADQYTEIEPYLTRPLTDQPIKRRPRTPRAAPKDGGQ